MTTFQDPQPQSRRAVRQGERGDAVETPAESFPAQPPAAPAAPQFFSDSDAQRDMWDTNARRAAQLPSTPAPRPETAVSGRRAAANASQPPAAAEPLNYATASRQPSAPSYDPLSFRSRLDARQGQQPASAAPQEDNGFRVRDFSPEGRRAAQAAERAVSTPTWVPNPTPADLDYQTEVREGFGMQQAPAEPAAPIAHIPAQYAPQPEVPELVEPPRTYSAPPQAVAAPPTYTAPEQAPAADAQPAPAPTPDAPGEQTLSRRELRALMAEQQGGIQQPESFDQPTYNAPVAWRTPEPAPFPPAVPAAAAEAQAAPAHEPPFQEAAVQEAPAASIQAAPQPYSATSIPEPVLPAAAPQPSTNTAMTDALAEFDALTKPDETSAAEPANWRPPVGHWSTQAEVEDDGVETTINRRVGSGSSTTNALVLPGIPLGSDIRGPLTSTGEVMLTGSIDLPHALSSTGSSDRMEHAGIDSLFDLHDHEVISTDSQPVRAIKAVSTHQSGHGVTHTQKPKGNRALTVLLISASSMAVVVAGLLIAAFAFKIF